MEQTTNLVSQHFRQHFEAPLLEELAKCPVMDLPGGTQLRQEAQSQVRYTPLVISGCIRVTRVDERGRELLMYHIRPGESCFLTVTASLSNNFGNVNSLKAICEERTVFVSLTDQQIRDWNHRYRSFRNFLAQLFNSRFAEFFSIIDNVVFRPVEEKLADALDKRPRDQQGQIAVTHQELAIEIGTAREVVSRTLKQWERDGRVSLGRGVVVLKK
ncbi:MAG: helix-turn-helix domain-containing protein [Bacteroidetes bacterium]|nr:helix-turn-helix domain-containing protein [Bacteroidota bacterium]